MAAVVDLSMPGLEGGETLAGLRGLDPGLPVLLTSGYSEQGADRLLEDPGVAFLAKPFAPNALAEAVGELLD